jgi:hypothetical protein
VRAMIAWAWLVSLRPRWAPTALKRRSVHRSLKEPWVSSRGEPKMPCPKSSSGRGPCTVEGMVRRKGTSRCPTGLGWPFASRWINPSAPMKLGAWKVPASCLFVFRPLVSTVSLATV